VRAWEKGDEHAPRFENAHTVASGIRVPQAVGDFLILRAVRESGGFAIAASFSTLKFAFGVKPNQFAVKLLGNERTVTLKSLTAKVYLCLATVIRFSVPSICA